MTGWGRNQRHLWVLSFRYRDYVWTIVTRVNTINGRTYLNDPTIFSWGLINEPRCQKCPPGTIAVRIVPPHGTFSQSPGSDGLALKACAVVKFCRRVMNTSLYADWYVTYRIRRSICSLSMGFPLELAALSAPRQGKSLFKVWRDPPEAAWHMAE
jgi:hypothetical protein